MTKILAVTAILGMALGVASPASADVGVPSAADITALATASVVLGTADSDETPLADAAAAANCTPGTRTVHAKIVYKDAAGNNAFAWHHNVTWSWNCTKITSASHDSYLVVFEPPYSFGGYLANTLTGVGTATVNAFAQGRVGICSGVVVEGCFLENDPAIGWQVTARGGAKVVTKSE